MVGIEFLLLGAPRILVNGQPLDGRLLGKDRALLYYLATTRTPQPRTLLATLLWGDHDDEAARGNLRKTLSTLHAVLGDLLQIEREQIGLAPGAWRCDVGNFEQAVSAGLASDDARQLADAAAHYTGEFLAGFGLHSAPDFELWQAQMSERLRRLAASALAAGAQRWMKDGDPGAAAGMLERLLQLEPWNEEAHRARMIALAQAGQRSAALRQYQQCVEQLAAELAVAPSAETEALYASIRAGEISPAPRLSISLGSPDTASSKSESGWRPTLPLQLSPIVGRESELAELTALLATPDCRLVNLLGPGGIGKTRLALALAHQLAGEYPAAAMLSLAGVNRAEGLLATLESRLRLEVADGASDVDAVAAALHRRFPRLLLVLDNFEQLLPDGLPIVEQLLSGAPGLTCIVTSRQALNTSWEWRYPVQELAYPDTVNASGLDQYSAVRLFLMIARRTRPRTAITASEILYVARICQLVAGLPLGIELAAAHVGHMSVAAIAEMLARDLEHFETTFLDLPPRQRSLMATFETSWAMLTAAEQDALARLSPLHSEFTLDCALHLTDAGAPILFKLVDLSLLRAQEADIYSLHEVTRRLAERKLREQPGAWENACERYRAYFTNWGSSQNLSTHGQRLVSGDTFDAQLLSGLHHLHYLWANAPDAERAEELLEAISITQHTLRRIQLTKSADTFHLMAQLSEAAQQDAALPEAIEAFDVIWLPTLVHRVVDLREAFREEYAQLLPTLQDACTIGEHLVAFPSVLELGMLFYRRDLLEQAGFGAPPRTWDELEMMAAEIQARQRAAGHTDFWGYIWPGNPSEHMMGDFMEWLHSEGGGTIVERDGHISVNNPAAVAALQRARRWVGVISPPDMVNYYEVNSVQLWYAGRAAFLRRWMVGYSLLAHPIYGDRTGVTLLPAGSVRHAATLGGWPLAVRKESAEPQRAMQLIKAIASPPLQRQRALQQHPTPPSLAALYSDPELLAHAPVLGEIRHLLDSGGLAVRPAKVTGSQYPQVSTATMKAVGTVLYDGVDAAEALALLETTLATLLYASA